MLVLSRKKNESIVIDGDITVTVLEVRGDTVRLGIVCPKEVPVYRQELAAPERTPLPPFAAHGVGAGVQREGEIDFIEISLGQLMAQVGLQGGETGPEGEFTNEGEISPSL